ncbi:MAG: HAD-IB family phosphatase [Candidatus Uhrbacteria bacterium]
MVKPAAFFDIDGTLIRSSLLIEIFKALVRRDVFPSRADDEIEPYRRAWIERRGSYRDYIMAVVEVYYRRIVNCREDDVVLVGQMVAEEQRQQVYAYTRGIIGQLQKSHVLVAISGSPVEVVKPFADHWGFHGVYASETEVIDGRYTDRRLQNAARDKVALVSRALQELDATLEGSVDVGDTEGDVPVLGCVTHPVAFNPNAELLALARERGWKIVVERKDVVYRFRNGEPVTFVTANDPYAV